MIKWYWNDFLKRVGSSKMFYRILVDVTKDFGVFNSKLLALKNLIN